jgi:hypothetical protein
MANVVMRFDNGRLALTWNLSWLNVESMNACATNRGGRLYLISIYRVMTPCFRRRLANAFIKMRGMTGLLLIKRHIA